MALTDSMATATFSKQGLSLIGFNLSGGVIVDTQDDPDDPVDPIL